MTDKKSFMDDVEIAYNKAKIIIFKEKKGPLTKEDRERAMAAAMDSIFSKGELDQIAQAVSGEN